jgi:hypothetical protein
MIEPPPAFVGGGFFVPALMGAKPRLNGKIYVSRLLTQAPKYPELMNTFYI